MKDTHINHCHENITFRFCFLSSSKYISKVCQRVTGKSLQDSCTSASHHIFSYVIKLHNPLATWQGPAPVYREHLKEHTHPYIRIKQIALLHLNSVAELSVNTTFVFAYLLL